jgi:diadenosine tetraphosphatase ApaH/serine/threonine PP2A family protein phosphatase
VHGGITTELNGLSQINKTTRGETNPEDSLTYGLLWNDPKESIEYYKPNSERGVGLFFGQKAFDEFLSATDLSAVIRGHQRWPDGYKFFFKDRLCSVFSCDSYGEQIRPKAVVIENTRMDILELD